MQNIEHIQWYAKIIGGLLERPDVVNRLYWEGAHEALNWALEPEREFFDPRPDSVRKNDDLKIPETAAAPEEVRE